MSRKNVNPRALAATSGVRPQKPTAPAVSTGSGKAILPVGLDRPMVQQYAPQTATNPAAAPRSARRYLGDVDAHNQSIRDMPQVAKASAQPVVNRKPSQPAIQSAYRGAQPGAGFADRPLKGVKGAPRHGR